MQLTPHEVIGDEIRESPYIPFSEFPPHWRIWTATNANKILEDNIPTLIGVAQVICGRPVAVFPTFDTPCTDGSNIWLRAPIKLGLPENHPEAISDSSAIYAEFYHEIAHISEGSFEDVSAERKTELWKLLKKLGWDNAISRVTDSAGTTEKGNVQWRRKDFDYLQFAKCVHPALPFVINCLEDARVNRRIGNSRPGIAARFLKMYEEILDGGYDDVKGYVDFAKTDLSFQILLTIQADLAGWGEIARNVLVKKATTFVDDSVEIQRILKKLGVVEKVDVGTITKASMELLAYLIDQGIIPSDDDEPEEGKSDDEPEGEGESDDEPEGEGKSDDEPEGEGKSDDEPEGDSGNGKDRHTDNPDVGGDPDEDFEDDTGDTERDAKSWAEKLEEYLNRASDHEGETLGRNGNKSSDGNEVYDYLENRKDISVGIGSPSNVVGVLVVSLDSD